MNRLAHPHVFAVIAILALSVAGIFWNDARQGERVVDAHMRAGTVQAVLEERASVNAFTRMPTEQVLQVLLESGETVSVINDLVLLDAGTRVWAVVSAEDTDQETWYIIQPRRTGGLMGIALLFVALVMLVAGYQGIRALVGLIASLAVVLAYLVPRILAGGDPVLTGLAAAVAILLITLYVTHGLNRKSLSALAGITLSLGVVALLAHAAVQGLHLTGYGAEEVLYLNVESAIPLNLIGLLMAGIIIAALGVLDDVAVTQASTVWQLARTDRTLQGWRLFRRAMVVGRDHIAAVTNTLVLAYVGAALPLVLLTQLSRFPFTFIVSGDILVEEIVLTLLSSIGLVLAVPLTTAVAAVWVARESSFPIDHET
jgi:uncharacterized membrane protein